MKISHYLRMGVGRRDYKGARENLFAGDGHVHYIAIIDGFTVYTLSKLVKLDKYFKYL